jgi:hypothetical protein
VDGAALPPDGATYPQILRGGSYVWWRSVLGVVVGLALFLLITSVVSQALVTLFWATTAGNQSYREYFAKAFAFRTADRHVVGEPRPGRFDTCRLGADGSNPPDEAEMARPRSSRGSAGATCSHRWRLPLVVLNGVMLLSTTVGKDLSSSLKAASGGSLS